MAAMAESKFVEVLKKMVQSWFGDRAGDDDQKPTSAAGIIEGFEQGKPFVTRQGGPVKDKKGSPIPNSFDARNLAVSKLKKGEWTGYHAEMIIVSAMIKVLSLSECEPDVIVNNLRRHKIAIVANAPCCKHCANMLTFLNISYSGKPGPASLTGWWNPLVDLVAAHGSADFNKDIPFLR